MWRRDFHKYGFEFTTHFSMPFEDTSSVVSVFFMRVLSLFLHPDAAAGNLSVVPQWRDDGIKRNESYNSCGRGCRSARLSQNLSSDPIFSLSSEKWRSGLGRGGAFLWGIPLSSILSPLVPHRERRTLIRVLRHFQRDSPCHQLLH